MHTPEMKTSEGAVAEVTVLSAACGVRVGLRAVLDGEGNTRRERERCAVAAILRHFFGESAETGHRADGSPFLLNHPEVCISVSHSRLTAAVAVGAVPVGVDVEEFRPQLCKVAPRVLSDSELGVYGGSSEGLLKAWTLKEALYKCAARPGADFRADIILPELMPLDDDADAPAAKAYVKDPSKGRSSEFRILICRHITPSTLLSLVTPEF